MVASGGSSGRVAPPAARNPSQSALSTVDRRSGACAAASTTSGPNGAEYSRMRARESRSTVARSRAVSIVETGTATAPIRIAPRIADSSSTPSTMRSMTRSSGRTPLAFNAWATAAAAPDSSA